MGLFEIILVVIGVIMFLFLDWGVVVLFVGFFIGGGVVVVLIWELLLSGFKVVLCKINV